MHLVKQIADCFVIITINTTRSRFEPLEDASMREIYCFFALVETLMATLIGKSFWMMVYATRYTTFCSLFFSFSFSQPPSECMTLP